MFGIPSFLIMNIMVFMWRQSSIKFRMRMIPTLTQRVWWAMLVHQPWLRGRNDPKDDHSSAVCGLQVCAQQARWQISMGKDRVWWSSKQLPAYWGHHEGRCVVITTCVPFLRATPRLPTHGCCTHQNIPVHLATHLGYINLIQRFLLVWLLE